MRDFILWWLIAMSTSTIFIAILEVDKPRKPMTRLDAAGYTFWSLIYIVMYLYLLGVFK